MNTFAPLTRCSPALDSEAQRLALVTEMTRTEYDRLKAAPAGNANYYALLAGSADIGIQLIDVREPTEFTDVLGHIRGARLVPLSQLTAQLAELDRSRPVVAVCRSGARSAQATVLLTKAGFEQVANLAGGMLRWRIEGLPVAPGSV